MLKIRCLESSGLIKTTSDIKHYADMIQSQFLDIYMPDCNVYQFVDINDKANICIVGTQHVDNSLLRDDEINIFFTVENFSVGRRHYQHLNKFGRYGNPKIHIYIYNDVIIPTNNTIPAIYQRINYFNKLNDPNSKLYYNEVRERYNELNTPFHEKKFCLFISQNGLNSNKQKILNELSQIGQIDFLMELARLNPILNYASCYNSYEILKVFNQYKFIICFENSKTEGYITEKIFNVFLSKSIPIYDGDPKVTNFINSGTFLQYDNNIIQKVKLLMNNEQIYNSIIKKEKTKELDYTFINNNFKKLF